MPGALDATGIGRNSQPEPSGYVTCLTIGSGNSR